MEPLIQPASLSESLQTYLTRLPEFIQNPNPEIYRSNNYVYLDFENTNLAKGSPYNKDNRILLATYRLGCDHPRYEDSRTYFKWGSEFDQSELVQLCEESDFIVAHNAKHELGWLRRCGLDISRVLSYCTQIGEYVIAGNRKWRLSLDAALARNGLTGKDNLVSLLIKNGVCPSEIPESWLLEYGLTDAIQGEQLFLLQREEIYKKGLHKVFFTRNIVTAAIEHIERVGMHLDPDRVKAVYTKFTEEYNNLANELIEITGGINIQSPDQKAKFLYKELKFPIPTDHKGNKILGKKKNEEWPDGVPSTKKEYIERFIPKTKKQKRFLELFLTASKIETLKSKTLNKFLECVETTKNNIVHFSLNQTVTSTHRLSSTGRDFSVQGQNFPRILKPLFCPRNKGWEFGEADEAQLEYRIAVALAEDEAGISDIKNGVDSHAFTASIIFKEQWEECEGDKKTPLGKWARQESKSHTFKPLYGGTSGTPRQQEYYEAFKTKHKQITEKQQLWIKEVYQTRKLVLPTGLILHFDDCKMNRRGMLIRPDGRPVDQAVCNYPVQNIATAELVLVAIAILWRLMVVAQMKSFLVNTVHDSGLAEIFPPERELFDKFAVYSMVEYVQFYFKKVYDMEFCVPLEAETSYGTHWATNLDWEKEYL